MSTPNRPTSNGLARLVGLSSPNAQVWSSEELAELLATELDTQLIDGRSIIQTMLDPAPALELLRGIKDRAKASEHDRPARIPHEIAVWTYLSAIAVAQVRCATQLSGLPVEELRSGFQWAEQRTWADDRLVPVLQQALAILEDR